MPSLLPRPLPARATLASGWCGDADFGGVYSYLRPGGTPADRDALGREVAPGLVLAGEHTWRAHPGTLHGAIFSGERAARLLLAQAASGPVVVVGAGLAGLAAAQCLRDAGRRVVVLEAGAEPGGRARSETSLGGALPLGGAWLHGIEGHPLAGEVTSRAWPWTAPLVTGAGRLADDARRERVRLLRETLEAQLDATLGTDGDAPLIDSLRRAEPSLGGADPTDLRLVRSGVSLDYTCLVSAPLAQLSTRHRLEPFHLPGGDRQIIGGLPQAIARRAHGLDLRLRHRVVALERATAGTWTVRCDDGTALEAPQVVCAAPLTSLRDGRIAVRPGLPAPVHGHLQKLALGVVAKLFVAFDAAWWAPHAGFVVGDEAAPLPLWADVSSLAGRPVLCAFASGAHALQIEAMDAAQRLAFADAALAAIGPGA